jgi:hypothetical protein
LKGYKTHIPIHFRSEIDQQQQHPAQHILIQENELAQAKGTGGNFVNYWMHNGFINIHGEKVDPPRLGRFLSHQIDYYVENI